MSVCRVVPHRQVKFGSLFVDGMLKVKADSSSACISKN